MASSTTVTIDAANLEPVRAALEAATDLVEIVGELVAFVPAEVNPIVLDRRQHLDRLVDAAESFREALGCAGVRLADEEEAEGA